MGERSIVSAYAQGTPQRTRRLADFVLGIQSIYVYKAMLVGITRAFDVEAIDRLLFLESCKKDFLVVSGDGVLHFARLIAAGLATAHQKSNNNWQLVTYAVNIHDKGRQLVEAWKQGDRIRLRRVLGGPVTGGVKKNPSKKR